MDYLERRNDRFVFFVFRPRWSVPCPQNHITTSASHYTQHTFVNTEQCSDLDAVLAKRHPIQDLSKCKHIEKLLCGRSGPTAQQWLFVSTADAPSDAWQT